ncbi:hypothetical protein N7492_010281 [Penicillium capsulatum]|uniref:26S proteasome complex subunit SEM1 n=1 Tax=Penicillium capsulatum TaxID=69766 RepID=A0A9W9LDR4_9EURO|nr:hypothetical protein N7492_010281 [Penicillium capsulatum]KAJ6112788.1 hypothetical protein N7512_008112 [Penicillium capsulatum]
MSNSQAQNQADATEKPQQKPQVLEEDDEFEDFPVEDWPQEEAEQPSGSANGGDEHLWEESWDDNAEAEEFSKQLKEELKKVEAH